MESQGSYLDFLPVLVKLWESGKRHCERRNYQFRFFGGIQHGATTAFLDNQRRT
jgi:hypothetical protein